MSRSVEDNFIFFTFYECRSYTNLHKCLMILFVVIFNILHFICNWIKFIFKRKRWKKLQALLLWKDIHQSICLLTSTALQQLAIIHWIQWGTFKCVHVHMFLPPFKISSVSHCFNCLVHKKLLERIINQL